MKTEELKMPELGERRCLFRPSLVVVATPASHLSDRKFAKLSEFYAPEVFGVVASASETVHHHCMHVLDVRTRGEPSPYFMRQAHFSMPQVPRRSCFSGNRAAGVAQILSFLSARSSASACSQEATLDWNIQFQSQGTMAEYSHA